MAIDFNRTRSNAPAANKEAAADRPKSQFWINVGYNVEVPVVQDGQPAGVENRFVSLPVGLPLDIAQKTSIKGHDAEFVAIQTARNELLEQLLEFAEKLAPGETKDIDLVIQLRRVNGEAPVIKTSDNPFSKKLSFAG